MSAPALHSDWVTGGVAIVSLRRAGRTRSILVIVMLLALAVAAVATIRNRATAAQLDRLQQALLQAKVDLAEVKDRHDSLAQAYGASVLQFFSLAQEKERVVSENDALATNLNSIKQRIEMVTVSRGGSRTFSDYPLLTPSWATAQALDKFLAGSPLAGSGSVFIQAEVETGVNAVALLALCIHEGAWGRSAIAREKNNCFGFGASDVDPHGQAIPFPSFADAVTHVARYLQHNYLTPGGRYHQGGTLRDMNPSYASDPDWHGKVAGVWARIVSNIYTRPATLEDDVSNLAVAVRWYD